MRALPLEEFDAASAAFDRDVARTDGIDAFCSTSDWVIPAHQAFGAGRAPWIFRGESGWVALARGATPGHAHVLQPLEPVWGFASPCVGGPPAALASEIAGLLVSRAAEWELALLTGLDPDGALWRELAGRLSRRHRLFRGPATARYHASLAGGLDAFLARRSRSMRRTLSRAARAARAAGVTIERASGAAQALYARVLDVEARSWKGQARTGIADEPMRGFYARMLPRLQAHGRLRLSFARHRGRDVAYLLGGVAGALYRGLQCSYDAGFAALGLGNVLHLAQIEALCAEGFLVYDLGGEVAYKSRWAETVRATAMLVVTR